MEKKYDHLTGDAKSQQKWAKEQTYKPQQTSKKQLFSIDTPPPTVSGSLHIGHIFSYTQTDIIARFKRLSGFNVFYPFGFDDNGLPTEKYVEKKHKVSAHRMGRTDFIQLCSKESQEIGLVFAKLWQRMGISADWSRTYSTISADVRKISQASFIDLYNKGFVYQKEDPALYCTVCQTTVAQAELDDAQVASHFSDITFKTTDDQSVVIGTTRPELLPSCVALFYHPADTRYTHLAGKKVIVPIFGHEVPVLPDETVQQDKGTGLVMCCTFGDKNDIHWYKTHKLPYRQSIERNGTWSSNTGILAGMKAHVARETILAALEAEGLLGEKRPITHTVNVHERCKHEIEYIVIKQWFLNILDHKQAFLDAGETIAWHPTFMKSRYRDWVENLQWDWCLSRQRFYGIPFPAWHCMTCQHIILPSETTQLPIDPQETDCPVSVCPQCSGTTFRADSDVMDTWNTSSLTPYICDALFNSNSDNLFGSKIPALLPMSMRPQAHDIIRTWAFYTIIKGYMHHSTIPWKEIVISGHVLSSEKDKISKSKGNTPTDPENLLKVHPADAIRFWTASGTLGQDISFSETQLSQGNKLLNKLWNAFRFLEEHVAQAPAAQPETLGTLNEWLLHKATKQYTIYQANLDKHEFGNALNAVEQFFWQDFCDNYLELVKDQFFNPEKYPAEIIAATRWTLYQTGLRILQMFAPYLPHITEELYGLLYQKREGTLSIHITNYTTVQIPMLSPKNAELGDLLIAIVGAVRRMKTEKQLSLKAPLTSLTIHSVHGETLKALLQHEQLLKGVIHADTISYATGDVEKSTLTMEHEVWFATLDIDHITDTKEQA